MSRQSLSSAGKPPKASPNRILIIDDDITLAQLIRDFLQPVGFDVGMAHTGADGLRLANSGGFDAVVLDVLLPGMDGFEVLRRLRWTSQIPVLMLTGMGSETDRIVGLEIGADDYLPKTYSMRELLARLRALLRRANAASSAEAPEPVEPPIQVRDLIIDPGPREASVAGQKLDLTPIEFDMLCSLARGCGRVLSREQLLRDASPRELGVFDRSVDVHVSSLRRKLGDDPGSPRYIRTVRSAGYMMPRPGQDAA